MSFLILLNRTYIFYLKILNDFSPELYGRKVSVDIVENCTTYWGFPGGQTVKNLPAMQKTQVWFLGWEDPLEKEPHL